MSDRTVLITGAGSGIGRGLAERFGAAGFEVIAADINKASAEEIAGAITAAGGKACAHEVDVAQESDVLNLVEALGDGPVDVLVNNAGLQHMARLEDLPQEKWDLLIRVMLTGPFMVTRALLPRMRGRGFGRIINLGSIHSLVASPYKSAYVAAKHGLLGLAKVVALETAGDDITINSICPSYIHTPLVARQVADQAREHGISEEEVASEIMLKPMPKKQFVTIDELYGIAMFLISDSARNITGQTISVDGGWTIQ